MWRVRDDPTTQIARRRSLNPLGFVFAAFLVEFYSISLPVAMLVFVLWSLRLRSVPFTFYSFDGVFSVSWLLDARFVSLWGVPQTVICARWPWSYFEIPRVTSW